MQNTDPRVDAYLQKAPPFAQEILTHLRALVHATCPGVEETWKWSFPNFMYKGALMCSMAAFKQHCSFGFWKAALMENEDKAITVTDRHGMGHLGKITSLNDLPKDAVLKKYIKAAMKLNEDGVKLPPRPKPTEEAKKELQVPAALAEALKGHPKAKAAFDAFSYSHRKEYIEWITEAKTEPTRDKRIATTLEWLTDGKGRNWKYEKC